MHRTPLPPDALQPQRRGATAVIEGEVGRMSSSHTVARKQVYITE